MDVNSEADKDDFGAKQISTPFQGETSARSHHCLTYNNIYCI